ncbi:MAG: universal stress protein [Rhodospirillaceae bacterium]|jgi:nucleotide-binding universal stress UspA family protein|nr:universal stress protein [Rhodospirillaceae bacterium]MBT4219899.1 universal stress protein [Rhodospirillaceae bacterium]MBT4463460.1 universal stress protein [Rhodospirillaceae bacterium]MBT5013087.1 universal stress protein [Rhodospirillaceae bacterium]MBT6407201.1 universal stress protein [Rhodospirillaceae bacterium]
MSIRSIMVPLDSDKAAPPALQAAFMLARNIGAHAGVVHISPDVKEAVPLLGEGMSAAIIEEMILLAEKDAAEKTAAVTALFEDYRDRYGLEVCAAPPCDAACSASLISATGHGDEVTAEMGRLADLIVVSRPTEDSPPNLGQILNAALFETGRPVLVAPPTQVGEFGRKIAISWNGSAEASRAVAAAIPLIQRSEGVVILSADSDKTSSDIAPKLADYFNWHGVTAEIRSMKESGAQIGAALLAESAVVGADMLVMGAYTHSRMRQLILGGVTRHILAEATLPVLMAH